MSIAAVCVDQGRVIVKEASTARVEGRTTFTAVPGQWFKCRLFLNEAPDQPDAQRARWTTVPRPQVLTPVKDADGALLEFHDGYHVEVRSNELGKAVWRLSGDPQALRKKRRVIGWLLTVERVVERTYDDLLDQQMPNVEVI